MSGQLSYSERYAILAGRVIYADYAQRKQLINEGNPVSLNVFPPNHDASIMALIRQGEVNTTGAELSNYLNQIDASSGATSATEPTVPLSLCVIGSNSALTILFLPGADGGSPITNYSYSTDGVTFTPLSPANTTSPLTIPGLTNGTVYTVYIKAINAIGSSPASAAVTAAPIPSSFNPELIGNLTVWLDAQNLTKVITASGKVSGWDDSSSLGNNFTAGTTGIITYDQPSGINNRPALNFTTSAPTTSTYINRSSFNIAPGNNELTVFMILSQTGQGVGNSELFYTRNNYEYFDLFNNTNPNQNGLLAVNARNQTQRSSGVDIITDPPSIAIICTTLSTAVSIYVNGSVTSVSNATTSGLTLDTTLDWSISGGAFRGYIGEVITYKALLSDIDRQKVEGYLAWKWGLQSQLSASNPWKTAPPTNDSAPGAPTLTYILAGNALVYVYYTAGTGTVVNYQYTTNSGTSYANVDPADNVSPSPVTGLTNGASATINLRAYNSGGYGSISNGLTVTPSNPAVPAAWLLFDPNDSSCYSGTGTVNNIGTFGALPGTIAGSLTWITGTGLDTTGPGGTARKVFNFTGGRIGFGAFDFTGNFTISAWIYPTTKNSINTLIANGNPYNSGVSTPGFKFAWNSWQTTNRLLLFENGDSGLGWSSASTLVNTVTMNTWQQISVIFDQSKNISVFLVNGMPVSVNNINTLSAVVVNRPNFNIGAFIGGAYAMQAQLGLLKVFNSSLTAGQVLEDFTDTRSRFGV